MSRELKPLQIATFEARNAGLTVPIMFNRNDHTFFAELPGGEKLAAASKDAVLAKLNERAAAARPVEWSPVIEVTVEEIPRSFDYGSTQNTFGFRLRRGEVALKPFGGGYLWRDWQQQGSGEWQQQGSGNEFSWSGEAFAPPCRKCYRRKKGGWGKDAQEVIEDPQPEHYLPYTEETWAALEQLQKLLRAAKERLLELLRTTEGIAVLTGGGVLALPPPRDQASILDSLPDPEE